MVAGAGGAAKRRYARENRGGDSCLSYGGPWSVGRRTHSIRRTRSALQVSIGRKTGTGRPHRANVQRSRGGNPAGIRHGTASVGRAAIDPGRGGSRPRTGRSSDG